MKLDIETVGQVIVVTPREEALDAQSAKEFRREMEASLLGKRRVVLDLSPVGFVDSSGLGAILACLRVIEGGGGGLRLCGLRPEVRATLELVRMDRILDVHATRKEALAAARDDAALAP